MGHRVSILYTLKHGSRNVIYGSYTKVQSIIIIIMNKTEIIKYVYTRRQLFGESIINDMMLHEAYDIVTELNEALAIHPTERQLAKSIEEMAEVWMSKPE